MAAKQRTAANTKVQSHIAITYRWSLYTHFRAPQNLRPPKSPLQADEQQSSVLQPTRSYNHIFAITYLLSPYTHFRPPQNLCPPPPPPPIFCKQTNSKAAYYSQHEATITHCNYTPLISVHPLQVSAKSTSPKSPLQVDEHQSSVLQPT